uniref:Secreted protein n=1 Tax=Arion vulgaris TaxID=1028688 RepID=A0A0B6Y4P1_9EUPU
MFLFFVLLLLVYGETHKNAAVLLSTKIRHSDASTKKAFMKRRIQNKWNGDHCSIHQISQIQSEDKYLTALNEKNVEKK